MGRKKKEEAPSNVTGKAEIPAHRNIPKTELSEAQSAEEPGGDGMGLSQEGTANVSSVVGGAHGQAVGLPKPLPPKEEEESQEEERAPETGE